MADNKVQWDGLSVKWRTRKASHPNLKLDIDMLCGLISWFSPCKVGVMLSPRGVPQMN